MANASVVFGLEMGEYDSLTVPTLHIFFSAAIAAKRRQGIDIVEGDLCFFATDGSQLEANFSQKPYVEKDKYFPGVYTLKPGSGEPLAKVIAKIISQNASPKTPVVVYKVDDDEDAQWYGWPNLKSMEADIAQALKILPDDLQKRVRFE